MTKILHEQRGPTGLLMLPHMSKSSFIPPRLSRLEASEMGGAPETNEAPP